MINFLKGLGCFFTVMYFIQLFVFIVAIIIKSVETKEDLIDWIIPFGAYKVFKNVKSILEND